jgi:plasmid stabilization system protein ParE
MKYKSIILPTAQEDLRNAAKWYNKVQSGLGKQVVKRFREKIAYLCKYPLSCQIRYSEVHTALVEHFPYMIHYFVDHKNKTIVVISILHTKQSPEIWNDRLKEK